MVLATALPLRQRAFVIGKNQNKQYRIRKLTPKECFKLMGFDESDCQILIDNKISDRQLYKMSGNSIVVNVLQEIFKELLKINMIYQNNKIQWEVILCENISQMSPEIDLWNFKKLFAIYS